jgi:hypothetical protein
MSKQSISQRVLLAGALFLCCCAPSQKQEQKAFSGSNKPEGTEKVSTAELRRLYEAAKSQYERRAVCLRAIDEGLIRRGAPVSAIDEIFGTRFASDLPTEEEAIRKSWILFAEQFSPPPAPNGQVTIAIGYVGWYMAFAYDRGGAIQNYFLTNLHKGMSSYEQVKEKSSVAELKRLYEDAKSEHERRAICLRAIDEGVIQVSGPQRVSTIDEIFGTRFASDLPTRKERLRSTSVNFTSALPGQDKSQAAANTGWFLAVKYDYNGDISNYYLTNIHD